MNRRGASAGVGVGVLYAGDKRNLRLKITWISGR